MRYLNLKSGYTVLDGTLGGGGHALEILKKILPDGRLIGLDSDISALAIAHQTLKDYEGHFTLVNENFRNLDSVLTGQGLGGLDAALFDIGVSSYQLDDKTRGFSIGSAEKLDMRMDRRIGVSAYDIVNRYGEKDLSRIIEEFGEERAHRAIARAIVTARSAGAMETCADLAKVIHGAIRDRRGPRRIDPATKTFQAIRIAVNDELGALTEGLKKAVSWLAVGARICVISFHSLEDRIVKNLFKGYSDLGIVRIVTKKPVLPSHAEVVANPRARSAKLRAAERI